MKRTRLMLMSIVAFAAALMNVACVEENVGTLSFSLGTPDDGTDPAAVEISSGNYSRIFTISTDAEWSIEKQDDAGWLSIRPESGEGDASVYFSAAANKSPQVRATEIVFYCGDREMHRLKFSQAADTPYLTVTASANSIPADGGEIPLTVDTNAEKWEYEIKADGNWLGEKSKEVSGLTLAADRNPGFTARSATVTFTAVGFSGLKEEITITQNGVTADLLDIVFNNDGSATDASPMHNEVEYVPGASLMTYWNDSYGRYAARFNNAPGDNPSSGYYKVAYGDNPDFREALADGHSLEVLVMYDADADGEKEIKPFSSMQSGGTGFLITKADRGTELTFLPNLTSGGWQWTRSGVTPERGKYYHLVGVWDKAAGKSRIYVNGEQKAEVNTSGDFVFPNNANCLWFGIGCDAGDNKAEAGWKGDIVLARIYDDPLQSSSVAALWDEVRDMEPQGSVIELSDILFLPSAGVTAGSQYRIAGEGFENGDMIRLESTADAGIIHDCATTVADGAISFTIPSGFVSGTYRMVLLRGDARCPVGLAELTLSDTPTLQNLPEVVAHRGFHTTNGAAENSLASLEAAIALGVYGSEADFYITADGVVVSNHDPDINGIVIENSRYDDIKDITLSNGENVATLDIYLDEISEAGTKLVIEIKPHSSTENNNRVVDAIVEKLEERGMTDRADFISFDYGVCQRLASEVPGALVGYLNGDKDPWSVASDIKCIDYQMNVLRSHPGWVRDAHNRGMKVNVWTVNSTADMMEFISMGVDFITTDHPDVLKDIIGKLSE